MSLESPSPIPGPGSRIRWGQWLLLASLIALTGYGILPRVARFRQLNAEIAEAANAPRAVRVAVVAPETAIPSLTLPATVEALHAAPLYARANGYVRQILVDIGAPVRAGQVLAVIESPEVDQEYQQALAARDQARATAALTASTAQRWRKLAADSAVAPQELDEREGAAASAAAAEAAAEANARRLSDLRGFTRITAPFSGVITARGIDLGALVAPGGANATPLFQIARVDTVRVFVRVPQRLASAVPIGAVTMIRLDERPDRSFPALVVRTAGSLDPATRTLLVEAQAANPEGVLRPGMFSQVEIGLTADRPILAVPATTLMVTAEGIRLAVIDSSGKVHRVPVRLGRDYGAKVEVLEGVVPGEQVVLNPPNDLGEGEPVSVVSSTNGGAGK